MPTLDIEDQTWKEHLARLEIQERDLLAPLTERERQVWCLFAFYGMTPEQIADNLNAKNRRQITPLTAQTYRRRAQNKLCASLGLPVQEGPDVPR